MKWLRRRPTQRTLLVLLLFIVGGAIINVAIAWGCAIWSPLRWNESNLSKVLDDIELQGSSKRVWGTYAPSHWRSTSMHAMGGFGGIGVCGVSVGARLEPNDQRALVEELRCGLPWKCLVGGIAQSKSGEKAVTSGWLRQGGVHDEFRSRLAPYGVHTFPFAINTIFYAAMLWLLFTAPCFARRHIRIMRHRCPACGYLIGTSPVCTECGTPVRIQKS